MLGSPPVADALTRAGFDVVTDLDTITATLAAEPMVFPVFAAASRFAELTAIRPGSVPSWVSIGPGPHPNATMHGEVVHPIDLPASVEELITAAGGRADQMVESQHLQITANPEPLPVPSAEEDSVEDLDEHSFGESEQADDELDDEGIDDDEPDVGDLPEPTPAADAPLPVAPAGEPKPAPRRLWNPADVEPVPQAQPYPQPDYPPQPYPGQYVAQPYPPLPYPAPLPYPPQPYPGQYLPQPYPQPYPQPGAPQRAYPEPAQPAPGQLYPQTAPYGYGGGYPAAPVAPTPPAEPQANPSTPAAPMQPVPAPYEPVHQPVTRPDEQYSDDPDDIVAQVTAGGDRPTTQRRLGGGQVVIVGAGKGGVGKSSISQALAATAASAGLKVVLIDANVGQANQLSMLGVLTRAGLPTIVEAATSGDIKQAFLPPSVLNANRNPDLRPVRFVLVAGPPRGRANHPGVTPELYLDAVRYAQKVADLVVVDTQIVEDGRDDSGMVRRMMLPVLTSGGWWLGLSDDSPEGLIALHTVPTQMAERGVPVSHLLSMVNMLHSNVVLNVPELARRLQPVSRLIAAMPYQDRLKQMAHRRETLDGTPTFANPLEQVLELVSGIPVRTAPDRGVEMPDASRVAPAVMQPAGRRHHPDPQSEPEPVRQEDHRRGWWPFRGDHR